MVHSRVNDRAEPAFRSLVEGLPAVVYVADADRADTRYVSPWLEALTGQTPQDWIGDPRGWLRAVHPDDRDGVLSVLASSAERGEPFAAEYRVVTSDGRTRRVRDEAVLDLSDGSWYGWIVDISERAREDARLEFLAFHDPVTGLANGAFFEQHLSLEIGRARRTGETLIVCSIDLDRFKLVNDTLGHAAGDTYLREVAGRLQSCLRESDLVARVGGDEFAVVAPADTSAGGASRSGHEGAEHLAARLAGALEPPFVLSDVELRMSASIGTAVFPDDATAPSELLARADTTMYRAKRASHGEQTTGGEHVRGELPLASDLRRAAREGAWALMHQPIVELVTGRSVGGEALLRWPDPAHRDVEPRRFIAMAEELGLISDLSGWMIERLTRCCDDWQERGVLASMSLLSCNLSPRELWHPSLLDRLGRLRDAARRDGLIVVEITESSLMMDPARAKETLEEIRALGIRIALDDFGTGFSSLSRLQTLPIDIVKIDRTFLGEIDDPSARSIVQAMIRLTSALGMVAVAEGIETESQLGAVRELGCSLAQGFLFGEAVSADEFGGSVGCVLDPTRSAERERCRPA
jgi:diguanylate cyclase (GGDEF)-like protein/PAS domain S-box-containing protein